MENPNSRFKILFVTRVPNQSNMQDISQLYEMSYMGPLGETGQAEYDQLWVGPWMDRSIELMDWSVFQRCVEYQPDVLFICGWWLHPDDELKAGILTLFTFYIIRKLLKIKVAALLNDLAPRDFKTSDHLTRFCDLVFTHEHEDHFRKHSAFKEKHIVTHATFSPELFHGDPQSQRDLGVVFAGGVGGSYPVERSEGLAALRANGLPVTTPGGRGRGQKRLSNEEYAGFFKRSKIVVNWSRHISGKWFQAKARIFEATLAGAMLLCEECKEVNRWLQPYVDYVPFSTKEELVQRARYYLDHEEERLRIAVHGNRTALTKYSADAIWGQMVGEMREKSLYSEVEALEGLRRNASSNELRVARLFQRELKRFPQFDQSVVDAAVAIVEQGNKSVRRKLSWQRDRLNWHRTRLRTLHWRIMRKLLPAYITRQSVRATASRFYRRVQKVKSI